ncbi:hypothetical protein CO180_01920 [candidate division WWE3 bacterium CG_4_9_14_3_um_filter_41_6]|nr:MAG: hypothetical protein CO180_01920 [candidate division WWE3 bacterium CG_4_9_14_3_um_filter_41_6]
MRKGESFPIRSEPPLIKEFSKTNPCEINSEQYLPYIESDHLPEGVGPVVITAFCPPKHRMFSLLLQKVKTRFFYRIMMY